MKVYAVEDGEYSDYRIEGLFSTREKAEAFLEEIRKQGYSSSSGIAEFELDERLDESYGPLFDVHIDMETGDEVYRGQHESLRSDNLAVKKSFIHYTSKRLMASGTSAKSHDHALKLAVEKRQEVLRDAVQVKG